MEFIREGIKYTISRDGNDLNIHACGTTTGVQYTCTGIANGFPNSTELYRILHTGITRPNIYTKISTTLDILDNTITLVVECIGKCAICTLAAVYPETVAKPLQHVYMQQEVKNYINDIYKHPYLIRVGCIAVTSSCIIIGDVAIHASDNDYINILLKHNPTSAIFNYDGLSTLPVWYMMYYITGWTGLTKLIIHNISPRYAQVINTLPNLKEVEFYRCGTLRDIRLSITNPNILIKAS